MAPLSTHVCNRSGQSSYNIVKRQPILRCLNQLPSSTLRLSQMVQPPCNLKDSGLSQAYRMETMASMGRMSQWEVKKIPETSL